MTQPATPEHVRAALDLGWVGEVVICCDLCGLRVRKDYIAESGEQRVYAARWRLAERCGWNIQPGRDVCPLCVNQVRWCDGDPHGEACEFDDDAWVEVVTGDRVHPDDVQRYEESITLALSNAPRFPSFMALYRTGGEVDINDCVERWHTVLPAGPQMPSLAKYLGMTDDEYARWVSTGELPPVVQAA